MCRQLQRWLLFGSREANSLVSSKIVLVLHGEDRSRHVIRSYHGCYDALSYPIFFPKGELGWHMDILKKGVSMEEVIEYCALQKARSGSEEEIGLLFILFKYFASMYLSGYSTNNSSSWLFFCRLPW